MLKLLLATSLMGPVAFFSAAGILPAENQFQELSELSVLDRKVVSMSKCESSELYIFFHEEYIEMHSMDHLSSAIKASVDCEVDSIKVSYSFNDAVASDSNENHQKRSDELSYIFKAYYGLESVSFDKNLDVKGTIISDEPVAKISIEFGDSSTSVAS